LLRNTELKEEMQFIKLHGLPKHVVKK